MIMYSTKWEDNTLKGRKLMPRNDASSDFLDVLLYKANHDFIEGNRTQPYNALEIWDNLESHFGPTPSKFSVWRNKIVALILLVLLLSFATASPFGFMYVFEIDQLNMRAAGLIGGVGFVIGGLIMTGISQMLPRSLFILPTYTFAERESIYNTLCKEAEVVNGTIVDVVSIAGEAFITYTIKSPTYKVIRRTFKTRATSYTSADIGKEVTVLYLNETVNVLL
jgi:hypothetical protein